MNDRHPADDLLIARALDEMEGLEGEERVEIEEHLEACPRCAEVVRTLARAIRQFRESRSSEAPARILVDLMAEQAALHAARQPAIASHHEVAHADDRRPSGAVGSRFRRFGASLVPALAATALLLVLFLTGFWAGRQTVQIPVAPSAPADAASAPASLVVEARTPAVPHPLPDPPRIPFQTVVSEIR